MLDYIVMQMRKINCVKAIHLGRVVQSLINALQFYKL